MSQGTWQESFIVAHDAATKARIRGVKAHMKTFDYLFDTILGQMVVRHTDNLSRTLQNNVRSAAERQQVFRMTAETLKSFRSDESFDFLWSNKTEREQYEIEDPALPRMRKDNQ